MYQEEMALSLNGNTFINLKNDFDVILARTVGNMTMRGADEATVTLKLGISLEKESVDTPTGYQDVVKPSFKHDISSVMQIKDKMTGQFKGSFGMVYDEKKKKWVLRNIDDGQMDLFDCGDDEGEDVLAIGASEMPELPTRFDWLSRFVGKELTIIESGGVYTLQTLDGTVVLSSAAVTSSPYYCDGEKLAEHAGCEGIVCVEYGEDCVDGVAIECDSCAAVIVQVDNPGQGEDEDAVDDAGDYEYDESEE